MARGVGGRGPANIMEHLKGVNFPATKQELITHARQTAGPDTQSVVNVLQQIDDQRYDSPAAVMHQIGEVE